MRYLNLRAQKYYYRRRVPQSISHLCTIKELNRPLSSDRQIALKIASHYNNLFEMINLCLKTKQDPLPYIKELDLQPIKEVDIYKMFLNSKQGVSATAYREYKQQLDLLRVLLPKNLEKLNYNIIERVMKTVSGLPKRNIQKYRDMPTERLVKLKVPEHERISIKSQNEYLKTLRALLKFAHERQYIDREYTIKLFQNKVSARNQRLPLEAGEIRDLLKIKDVSSMSKILYYSGMRLSEVYKCKLNEIDGVKVFDLTDESIELKTQSSHRIIPVHSRIESYIEDLLEDAVSKSPSFYSRVVSKRFSDKRKSLYSIRHSFATELASKGVNTDVISELLGHTHSGMTLSRYVKGLPVDVLREAVDQLKVA